MTEPESTEIPQHDDPDETPIKYSTRPSRCSKGYVIRRRRAAINLTNWMLNEHPKTAIQYVRALAKVYNDDTAEHLEAVAEDLERAHDEGHIPPTYANREENE